MSTERLSDKYYEIWGLTFEGGEERTHNLFARVCELEQERSDAEALRLENDGLRRDREALALGGIPAPVSELAALRERIRLLEKMAMAEFLRAELYHSHLEDGCVMGPGVIAATEEARRVRIQDVVDDAHLLPDV